MTPTETINAALDAMQARANAAAPGPWCAVRSETGASLQVFAGVERIASAIGPKPDADFIAASRTDIPKLIAALRLALDRQWINEEITLIGEALK